MSKFTSETGKAAALRIPKEKRYFHRNREAARAAGRKGGQSRKGRGAKHNDHSEQ